MSKWAHNIQTSRKEATCKIAQVLRNQASCRTFKHFHITSHTLSTKLWLFGLMRNEAHDNQHAIVALSMGYFTFFIFFSFKRTINEENRCNTLTYQSCNSNNTIVVDMWYQVVHFLDANRVDVETDLGESNRAMCF